jgi:hypothetical protein
MNAVKQIQNFIAVTCIILKSGMEAEETFTVWRGQYAGSEKMTNLNCEMILRKLTED